MQDKSQAKKCQNNDQTQHKMQSASIWQHHCPFTAKHTKVNERDEEEEGKKTELFAICETMARISECNTLAFVCRTQNNALEATFRQKESNGNVEIMVFRDSYTPHKAILTTNCSKNVANNGGKSMQTLDCFAIFI